MTGEHDAQLAGELRAAQWAMDDLATALPVGRATVEQMTELADRLSGMAAVLRLRAGTQQHRQALDAGAGDVVQSDQT